MVPIFNSVRHGVSSPTAKAGAHIIFVYSVCCVVASVEVPIFNFQLVVVSAFENLDNDTRDITAFVRLTRPKHDLLSKTLIPVDLSHTRTKHLLLVGVPRHTPVHALCQVSLHGFTEIQPSTSTNFAAL